MGLCSHARGCRVVATVHVNLEVAHGLCALVSMVLSRAIADNLVSVARRRGIREAGLATECANVHMVVVAAGACAGLKWDLDLGWLRPPLARDFRQERDSHPSATDGHDCEDYEEVHVRWRRELVVPGLGVRYGEALFRGFVGASCDRQSTAVDEIRRYEVSVASIRGVAETRVLGLGQCHFPGTLLTQEAKHPQIQSARSHSS